MANIDWKLREMYGTKTQRTSEKLGCRPFVSRLPHARANHGHERSGKARERSKIGDLGLWLQLEVLGQVQLHHPISAALTRRFGLDLAVAFSSPRNQCHPVTLTATMTIIRQIGIFQQCHGMAMLRSQHLNSGWWRWSHLKNLECSPNTLDPRRKRVTWRDLVE